MSTNVLEDQKKKLLSIKNGIMNGQILKVNENLTISSEDLADEADLANNVINQNVHFNIREREMIKLRAIELALQKIEDGTYGFCEDCDEKIATRRLENQPWAQLCIVHAEEQERKSSFYGKFA